MTKNNLFAVTALLVMLLTATSAWADSLEALTLGANNLSLPGSDGNQLSYYYTFTPTETGTYRIWSESATSLGYGFVQCYVQLYGGPVFSDAEPSEEGHFDCQGELTANEEYTFIFSTTHEVGNVTVHIDKMLNVGDNTVAFTQGQTVTAAFTPAKSGYYRFYSTGDVVSTQVTIKDGNTAIEPSISSSTENNFDIVISLTSGKTYTVELSSTSGTANVTVTISKFLSPLPYELSLGNNTIPFRYEQEMRVLFVPTETGYYRFTSTGTDVDTKIIIRDTNFDEISSDDDSGEGFNFCCTQQLTGGTTYVIGFWSHSGTDDVTVTVSAVGTKMPVITSYVDANGTLHENVEAVPLDETMTTLPAGTYVVNSDVNYTSTVTMTGDCTLILGDGCTMNIGTSENPINDCGINSDSSPLAIYGQNAGSGKLNVYVTGNINYGISAYNAYVQHGGIIYIESYDDCIAVDGDQGYSYQPGGTVTVDGGKLTVTSSNNYGIFAGRDVTITGGDVSATSTRQYVDGIYTYGNIILGWTSPTDRIYVSSYSASKQYEGGTVSIRAGQKMTDGTSVYDDTTPSSTLMALTNTTLYPYVENIALTAAPATIFGEAKYVTTFYQGTLDFQLPEGAKAYTASLDGTKVVFHLIGDDGRVVPHDTAAIVVADAESITLTSLDTTDVTAYAGNILQGSDTPLTKPAGTVYVLNVDSEGALGFYTFTGSSIPAGKAYYVVE